MGRVSRTPYSRASSAGRRQRVLTLLPLALLSSAVTVHLAAPGPAAVTAAPTAPANPLPGTPLLATPPMTPASVSTHLASEASPTGVVPTVANGDVQGIPATALAAYQRAETVINAADEGCHLSWQLLAAIGEVESHHGRFGVSDLSSEGVATPPIIGIPLTGSGGTALVRDTDAGVLDGDQKFDRAVGPMQFIPSTWSVVGVDSDDDGERNPQDIDDAALGAAVYLCSGEEDLSTSSGQVVAVNRYNHSAAYVERVLSLMQQYLAGGYTAGPAGSLPPVAPTTVAAGRIDGLHDDPEGSFGPPSQPNTGLDGRPDSPPPRDNGTDLEPPTEPEGPTEPEEPTTPPVQPPPLVVRVVPGIPAVDDPCGAGNATWVQPANVKPYAWSQAGGSLIVSLTDKSVFDATTMANTHDYGPAADSGAACAVVIPSDSSDPNWPGAPEAPWAAGEAGAGRHARPGGRRGALLRRGLRSRHARLRHLCGPLRRAGHVGCPVPRHALVLSPGPPVGVPGSAGRNLAWPPLHSAARPPTPSASSPHSDRTRRRSP